MYLYLVQHGLAQSKDEDPKKPLKDEGKQVTEKMAKSFSKLKLEISEIRHSTKLRAKETAEIIAKTLGKNELLKEYENLSPNSDVSELVREVNTIDKNLLIVGHLPYLSKFVSALICSSEEEEVVKFKNSGVLCLSCEDKKWRIEWYLSPEWIQNNE